MDDSSVNGHPSNTGRRRRKRRQAGGQGRRSHGWLRSLYFSLAALWGYAIGVGVLLVALRAAGVELRIGGSTLAMILPGALLALLGAWVSAAAYRQSRRLLG